MAVFRSERSTWAWNVYGMVCVIFFGLRLFINVLWIKVRLDFHSKNLEKLLNKWPGKKYFGIYRFLPIFFALGAALEFSMINWRVGNVNFYDTFKRREAQKLLEKEAEEQKIATEVKTK